MLRSYYDILNITPDATKSEIKKQFKKLAKMYHPDVNTSVEAEYLFKEINKAADVLLDDTKRKSYDTLRNCYKTTTDKKPTPKNGDDITVNITINYSEALLGTYRTINISHSSICPKCQGHKFANGQKCSYCNGVGEQNTNRKINVKIPPAIKNGAKLRLKEEGHQGKNGGKNGNLYVVINIEQNEQLKIKDDIVRYDAQISPYMAILGGNITVPTLWGQATIKIPPLTKANQSFKLIDVGILDEKTNKKGEQIVNIVIQIPSDISQDEILLYEKLREINQNKKNAATFRY